MLGSSKAASGAQTYTVDLGPTVAGEVELHRTVVSNDDAGVVTFTIYVSNRPTFLPTMTVRLMLQPAPNAPPASPDVYLMPDGSLHQYDSSGNLVSGPSDITARYADGVATFVVPRAELPGASFYFQAMAGDSAIPGRWHSQDTMSGSYTLKVAGVSTVETKTQPARASTPGPTSKLPPKSKPRSKSKAKPTRARTRKKAKR